MNNRITIIAFTYSFEDHFTENVFEARGQKVTVKNVTAQVINFYSNAIKKHKATASRQ